MHQGGYDGDFRIDCRRVSSCTSSGTHDYWACGARVRQTPRHHFPNLDHAGLGGHRERPLEDESNLEVPPGILQAMVDQPPIETEDSAIPDLVDMK